MNRTILTTLLIALTLVGCNTPEPIPTPTPSAHAPSPTLSQPAERHEHEGYAEGEERDPVPKVDNHGAPAPEDVAQAAAAAEAFIDGWLTRDLESRAAQLAPVCAEALMESFTDPRFTPIHARRVGPVHVTDPGLFILTTRHRLDTGQVIEVELQLEPDAHFGWLAVAVREI